MAITSNVRTKLAAFVPKSSCPLGFPFGHISLSLLIISGLKIPMLFFLFLLSFPSCFEVMVYLFIFGFPGSLLLRRLLLFLPVASEQGPVSSVMCGLLIVVASLVAEHRL